MKRFVVFAVVVLMVFVTAWVLGATNNTDYIDAPFTDDSIEVSGTVYTTLGSLSVTQDTAGTTLFLVSGTVQLGNYAWVHLALCTDTTSAGVPEIVSAPDTTDMSSHEWWWRESSGDSKMRIPFSFIQHLDTDSVDAAVTLYLMGKVEQANRPAYLHDVRIDGISNLADQ